MCKQKHPNCQPAQSIITSWNCAAHLDMEAKYRVQGLGTTLCAHQRVECVEDLQMQYLIRQHLSREDVDGSHGTEISEVLWLGVNGISVHMSGESHSWPPNPYKSL